MGGMWFKYKALFLLLLTICWSFFGFILCFNSNISWQKYKCWQGYTSALHSFNDNSWRDQESFYPRWQDSDLIRFCANPIPWGHSLSSLHGGHQTTGSQTATEPLEAVFDLIRNLTFGDYRHWPAVFRVWHLPGINYLLINTACLRDCSLLWVGTRPMSFMWFRRTKKMNHHIHVPPLNNRILLSVKLVLHAYLERIGMCSNAVKYWHDCMTQNNEAVFRMLTCQRNTVSLLDLTRISSF